MAKSVDDLTLEEIKEQTGTIWKVILQEETRN